MKYLTGKYLIVLILGANINEKQLLPVGANSFL